MSRYKPYITRVYHKDCWSDPVSSDIPLTEIKGTYGKTVKDLMEHLQDFNYDRIGFGGILLLEHDIIVPPKAEAEIYLYTDCYHDDIQAFPYFIYPVTTGLSMPVLAHRVEDELGQFRWLTPQEVFENDTRYKADSWGLGCTYLPWWVVEHIDEAWDYPTFDTDLSVALSKKNIRAMVPPVIGIRHTHRGGNIMQQVWDSI